MHKYRFITKNNGITKYVTVSRRVFEQEYGLPEKDSYTFTLAGKPASSSKIVYLAAHPLFKKERIAG